MDWPRIVYHLTDGSKRSEKGIFPAYTYDVCETAENFEDLKRKGWSLTPTFDKEAIVRPDLKCNVYPDEKPKVESPKTPAKKSGRPRKGA